MSRNLQSSIWGPIPSDWEVKPLKSISPSQSVGLVINPSTYFDPAGQIPMLVGSNVSENRIDSSRSNRITEESNAKLPASRLRHEDLVVVRVGAPGITAVVPRELDGANCASMMIVRKHRSFSSEWLCAAFNSPIGREQIEGVQYGTAQKQFNISDAVNFVFPCPPLEEQEAIAEALSDADALIEGLERLIAKKRLIKQGAMQDLLTAKRRLPGFSREWELRTLGELVTIVMGQSPSSSAYNSQGEGLPLVQGNADIKGRRAIIRFFTRDVTKLGKSGDYLMTVRAPVGEIAVTDMDVCLGRGVCALRTDERIVYHIMVAKEPEWAKLSKGSTFDSVNGAEIKAFELLFPTDAEERVAVAQVLDDIDAEIQALNTRLEKARQVKEGMMRNLLTGRIRLV